MSSSHIMMQDFKRAVLELSPLQLSLSIIAGTIAVIYLFLARLTRSTTDFPGPPGET